VHHLLQGLLVLHVSAVHEAIAVHEALVVHVSAMLLEKDAASHHALARYEVEKDVACHHAHARYEVEKDVACHHAHARYEVEKSLACGGHGHGPVSIPPRPRWVAPEDELQSELAKTRSIQCPICARG
jgi:hypothetical protein